MKEKYFKNTKAKNRKTLPSLQKKQVPCLKFRLIFKSKISCFINIMSKENYFFESDTRGEYFL